MNNRKILKLNKATVFANNCIYIIVLFSREETYNFCN